MTRSTIEELVTYVCNHIQANLGSWIKEALKIYGGEKHGLEDTLYLQLKIYYVE